VIVLTAHVLTSADKDTFAFSGGGHHIGNMYSRGINLVVGPLVFATYLICIH
jgi:hypothetical protein